jgi:16S rRNA (adenine1518-N6/adenine1519-N6)-dimethyltransferase
MHLTSVKIVKDLFKEHKAAPFKRLGQNFLIDEFILRKIVGSADLQSNDVVLEIGPGIGTLTQELAKRTRKVITVEKDRKMIEILKETLKDFKNVEIIQGDVLKLDLKPYTLNSKSYKIIANLPYHIVAPVIRKFLESTEARPPEMVLMVQKEVAQRICAKPPDMNLLAVSVQFYAKPEILFYVSKNSFWPRPKVDGAVIKITPQRELRRTVLRNLFFKIVKTGFSQPRKQIGNNLANGLKLNKKEVENWLLENKIKPAQRAETLGVEDWQKLAKSFKMKI